MYCDLEIVATFISNDQLFLWFLLMNLKHYQNETEVWFYFFDFFPKREETEVKEKYSSGERIST